MNSPFETHEFRFYLDFKNDDSFGRIEITEPIGFDAQAFVAMQDDNRYGRDVEYGSEEIKLEFHDIATSTAVSPITLPNGVIIDRLTMGLPFLVEYDKIYGFESKVLFIIERNDVQFTVGNIDFALRETDRATYFRAIIIQNTDKALLKRRTGVKVDILGTEDLDGNEVEPVETHNILLKAKPVFQKSKWRQNGEMSNSVSLFGQDYGYYGLGQVLDSFGIQNSYVIFNSFEQGSFGQETGARDRGTIVRALTTLSGVIVKINKFKALISTLTAVGTGVSFALNYGTSYVAGGYTSISLFNYNNVAIINIPEQDYEIEIPNIPAGSALWISLAVFNNLSNTGIIRNVFNVEFSYDDIEIQTTSTEVDSVVKGIRHIDLMKAVAERAGGFNVIAPRYDLGGQFYDNFVLNGYLMRMFVDKPFSISFKEVVEQLAELNADYQVMPDKKLFIGVYDDFYPYRDLGAFIQIPNEEYGVEYNKRYLFIEANYKYKSFEQDKDEDGTIDEVHTEAQFMLPNESVENKLNIDVPFTRGAFKIEFTRRKNFISNGSTSLSEDDNKFIMDCVELPEGSTNILQNVLSILVTNTPAPPTLKILARDNFRWDLLGFQVGDLMINVNFTINGFTYGSSGTLEVSEIEPTLLTLTNIGSPFPSQVLGSHEVFISIEYPLTDVPYKNRTNEGFDIIENVQEPDGFSNLAYTIRRNMKYWESYINTAANYSQNGIFKNTYWKANGELITKLETETTPTKENESVPVTSLTGRIVTPVLYRTTVFAEYDDVLKLIDDLNTIFDDNTVGGFVRIADMHDRVIKCYPLQISYTWATKVLEIVGEELYEDDFVNINKVGEDLMYINQTGYSDNIVKPLEYKANGDYLQLFDYRGIPLNNPTRFNFYKVQGQSYTDIIYLCKAIDEIY